VSEQRVVAEQCTGRGARGVVVAAAPMAASIGADVLRAGGTAYDAVVAAALAEVVLLPPKCGLAGDLVAIRVRPGATEPDALLAVGPAPRRLADAVRARADLPDTGPLSVGVPGAPAGYAALAAEATMPLERLAAPAIALARHGFPWARICTLLGQESQSLVAAHNPGGTVYYPGGEPPPPGMLVRLPRLASLLEQLVARGAALFTGDVAETVVARVQAAGGILEVDDLMTASADWVPAAVASVAGWQLWATPAPTHGLALLDAVRRFDDRTAGAVLRAVRAAATERARTLADPLLAAGTSMVSAADADGNAVCVVHSNSYPRFGSGLIVDDYDLILANRAGRGFSADPEHPNFPRPGRRPATTLHAWAAGPAGGGPTHLGGTPGGANQMPWNAQSLRDLLDGEHRPGRLVTAPKWEWLPDRGVVRVETGASRDDVTTLAAEVPVERADRWSLRSAQQVLRRPIEGEAVEGGVDPRTGGLALGV
jgi:gamma-glutamyltranspeptidase / glutathione hydrolase